MKPIRKCNLPQNSDRISLYIDGSLARIEPKAFIFERKLYLPIVEVLAFLKIDVKPEAAKVIIEVGGNQYTVDEVGIKITLAGVERVLEFNVREISNKYFVETAFLEDELKITVVWEEETHSLYLASVMHYDGYRIAPLSIYKKKRINKELDSKFMFVDGKVTSRRLDAVMVSNNDGNILISGSIINQILDGHIYRFCFRYSSKNYVGDVPVVSLMELLEPDNRFRVGNMMYTEESYKSFDDNNFVDEKNIGIDKDALLGIFIQYPEAVSDRMRLQNYMRDIFPENTLEVNLFITAFDMGIAKEIEENLLDDIFVHKMIKKLVENNGLQMEHAINAVCLWCEIYGTRVLGKTFISKEKYNPIIQSEIIARESIWVEPSLNNKKKFGEIYFYEPSGWKQKEALPPYEGIYYYPYPLSVTGVIWISKSDNPSHLSGKEFEYGGLIAGMCQGDLRNLLSSKNIDIDGKEAVKINYMMKTNKSVMEIDTYILPTENSIYVFYFGEQHGLSSKMIMFENEFVKKITLK